MKILLMNQFFWPDFAATGQFLEDLARYLAREGHEVTVICGAAAYTGGSHVTDPPPVKILRVRATPFKRSIAGRGLSYLSFLAGALWLAFRIDRTDLVVTLTTPPLLSVVGTLLKRVNGSRHYIWEMDLFPDALVSLGALKKHSVLTDLLGRIADSSRKRSDGVIALGPCMRERLLGRGIRHDQIHVAENWADGDQIRPIPFAGDGCVKVVYSGNLGLSHDIGTIASAIEHLKTDRRFRFFFIGGGAGRSQLEAFCQKRQLKNVEFFPYRNRDQVGDSLASGDIGLVTMKDACAGVVVPSKVYGLMAAQRPILFIGPRSATPARLIEEHNCGWQIDCGDVQGLIRLLEKLFDDGQLIVDAGVRAREAFVCNYDLKHGVRRISAILRLPVRSDSARHEDLESLRMPLGEVLR